MTKFEEKLEILPIKNIEHPVGNTKYYAAVHVKSLIAQADEEISTLKKQLVAKEKQVMELEEADKVQGKEIVQLKSQLQQQALPVVPECVAVQIERVKNSNGNFATLGLFDWNHEAKPDYTKWIHENVFDFMRACTIGYTVEKPQLFYLREKNTGFYLNKSKNNGLELVPNPYFDEDNQFTQQEIGSMETGSYELMPVEDGE